MDLVRDGALTEMPAATERDLDRELLQRFLRGDSHAFDLLFLRHEGFVYNICLGILNNPEDARDITQDTFVKVYRSAAGFRGQSSFSTWIYRIAVNFCLDLLRRPAKRRAAEMPEDWEVPDSHAEAEEQNQRAIIQETLSRLRPDYRAALSLRYFQQLSYEEMADVLGMNVGRVKILLHRARKAFKDKYEDGEPI
ncbi:MAG TPA: RNA polymerase sigma factor [Armatimonadota bacterium]|jgi:RNA polymerase sigma-70 factor (ECF subfamily)